MKYTVWDGAIRSREVPMWAPLGVGPDGGGTYSMNDDIEFLEV